VIDSVNTSISTILRQRADEEPDALAFVFQEDDDEEHLTYAELHRRASHVSATLRDAGGVGERVVLLYPPGLDYVAALFGCFYAGAVAVPAYPPVPGVRNDGTERLAAVVADADPLLVLTAPGLTPAVPPGARALECDPRGRAHDASPVDVALDALALLQYTSGSTAAPRGVMVTHANLLANSEVIRAAFGHTRESRGVIWLPPYHDMGLVGGVLQPVFTGFPCVLMSPLAFVRRPLRWLRAISDHRATTSGGPNFAYELCLRRIPEDARRDLDLSTWSVAFNGSEPVRRETLEAFARAYAACGFQRKALHPCYGLAESTLMATGGPYPTGPVLSSRTGSLVSSGRPARSHRIIVVAPETRTQVRDGAEGEIWLAGPSVAPGYWGDPAAEAFTGRLRDGAGPFLRTGDLGMLKNGELYVTGRIKEMIVVAGGNHHPLDIESACERAWSPLRAGCGAAFAIDSGGREGIGIAFEMRNGHDPGEAIAAIRRAATAATGARADAIVLLEPGVIPKTSSGKVQRLRCRSFLDGNPAGVRARWSSDAGLEVFDVPG
jgi:acyl-CoA synthetase (AMP-forming)/AMP-acid ligase II